MQIKTLTLIDKAFALKKISLFSELDLDLLLAIADKMNTSTFNSSEEIFPINQEAHRMYFIIDGQVEIDDVRYDMKEILHSFDFFGEESLFNDLPRAYSAKAIDKVELLTLSKTHLMTIISECPNVAINLLYQYTANMTFRKVKTL